MRNITKKLSIGAAILVGSAVLAVSTGAQAHDWDHRYDRWHHERWVHERPVYVHERPVIVRERPVYMAPVVPYYAPPTPSGLNLNFNIPLN